MSQRRQLVVIDDKPTMLKMLSTVLGRTYDVVTFGDPSEALEHIESQTVDVVITDIRMPKLTGMEVLERVRAISDAAVILMTAYGQVAQAVEAVRLGAVDYLTKPFEPSQLLVAIERALAHRALAAHARSLEREVQVEATRLPRFIGDSPLMQQVRRRIAKVAPNDVTVLISGASGTGKEVVAREIHAASPRASTPFVVVHCAAVPRELLESELFGHAKAAFSGAVAAKRGMVEEAQGGTLFLDDINYLSVDLQAKVNRLVQDKEIKPVGGNRWRRVDVRILASANVDLEQAVADGAFREDLYYRLNIVEIKLPPLCERPGDIAELVAFFIAKHKARLGNPQAWLAPGVSDLLARQPWPGNVRQLENACERALILADSAELGLGEFELVSAPSQASPTLPVDCEQTYAQAMEGVSAEAARHYLETVLARFDDNVTQAAKHAGVARQHFYRLLKQFGVHR